MNILAVDFGTRRLGLAVGNTLIHSATPLPPLGRKTLEYDLEYIRKVVNEYEIQCLLFGRPLNMDGTPGRIVAVAENYANFLKKRLDLPLEWEDERLTSMEADELLAENESDPFKRKAMVDSVAAMVILNAFLESR